MIDPTGFDHGILFNVSKDMFHRFYRKVVLIMIETTVSLINNNITSLCIV